MTGDPRFVPGADHPGPPEPEHTGVVVAGRKLLVGPEGRFPRIAELPDDTDWVPLGTLDGVPVWGSSRPADAQPGGAQPSAAEPAGGAESAHGAESAGAERGARVDATGRWLSWRALAAELPEPVAALAGRALQVAAWRHSHRWCGACRAELADVPGEAARRCPGCDLYVPMQLSPAVLVAVTRPGPAGRPDELLLVRHSYGPTELWALVAGFVEAGETLEAAVHREVGEEVGLAVADLAYFGSQPWAMSGPGVLLTGFTATAADPSAEPVVDGRELVQARWFPLDALPAELPPAYSISRWLVDAAAAGARR